MTIVINGKSFSTDEFANMVMTELDFLRSGLNTILCELKLYTATQIPRWSDGNESGNCQESHDHYVTVSYSNLDIVARRVIELVLDKNEDYGDSWQASGILGVLCRISDKLMRVETISDGRQALVANEGIGNTLLDTIGYSMLALLWLAEHSDCESVYNYMRSLE